MNADFVNLFPTLAALRLYVKTTVCAAKETNHRKLNDNLGTTGDPATKVLQEFVDALLPD
jgi:hypothetical protein